MVVRRIKKSGKFRGSKTHGWGSKKKHRGAGSRGGRGNAGLMKHKKSLAVVKYIGHIGKRGFKINKEAKKTTKTINLKNLDLLALKLNKSELNLNKIGFSKVLSTGKLTQALTVKAKTFTPKARAKIEESGGKAVEE